MEKQDSLYALGQIVELNEGLHKSPDKSDRKREYNLPK